MKIHTLFVVLFFADMLLLKNCSLFFSIKQTHNDYNRIQLKSKLQFVSQSGWIFSDILAIVWIIHSNVNWISIRNHFFLLSHILTFKIEFRSVNSFLGAVRTFKSSVLSWRWRPRECLFYLSSKIQGLSAVVKNRKWPVRIQRKNLPADIG